MVISLIPVYHFGECIGKAGRDTLFEQSSFVMLLTSLRGRGVVKC